MPPNATKRGRTLLDRERYLPRPWAADTARRAAAGVPAAIGCVTKPQLARRMIARALAGSVPCTWLTGDAVYGHDWRMRAWLEARNLNYVLGVTAQYRMFTGQAREWAATVVERLPATAWQRHSCGAGSKGERVYDWASMAWRQVATARQRWLLARRSVSDPTKITYYVASGPQETPLDALARVAGTRWAIEESFETAKGEVGLDQYEVRSWQGWYRHITLALLAHAYLTVLRARASAAPAPGGKSAAYGRTDATALLPLTVPEVRRLVWWLVGGEAPSPHQIIGWSQWRHTHQARAKWYHYKRRAALSRCSGSH
jgi:SRSO17 transposase